MVGITTLWLPILLSAVGVFIASSVIHMVIGYHAGDFKKLPDEAKLLDAMREAGVAPGDYAFPCPSSRKEMGSPEMKEKWAQGPVGTMIVMPNGPPPMGKALVLWFIYCILISIFVAYLTGRTLGAGAEYLAVFRVAGTVAFLGYAAAHASETIWKSRSWSVTFKHVFDGLIYGLVTGGFFGWLWP